jgi:hypothetical protein
MSSLTIFCNERVVFEISASQKEASIRRNAKMAWLDGPKAARPLKVPDTRRWRATAKADDSQLNFSFPGKSAG